MTDVPNAAPAAPAPVAMPDAGPLTVRQATQARVERAQTEAPPQADVDQKPPVVRAPDGKFASTNPVEDAAPEEVRSEEPVTPDPVDELPPIDAPRSWSKEDKELFASLPRETQERVADRERSRESDFLRRQNEAAEHSKAAQAERQQAEQARQQFEQRLQQTIGSDIEAFLRDFPEVNQPGGAEKLAKEDPFRWIEFNQRANDLQRRNADLQQVQHQRQQEESQAFQQWASEQDKLFTELVPEFADKTKADTARKEVVSYLTDAIGLTEGELSTMWNGQTPFHIRDAKAQRIMRDAAKWHAASKKAVAAAKAPVPQVQRPGTAPAKGANSAATIASLEQQLNRETSPMKQAKIATELRLARRA